MSTTFYDDRPGVPEAQRKLLYLTHNPIEPELDMPVQVQGQQWVVTRVVRRFDSGARTYDLDIYLRPLCSVSSSGSDGPSSGFSQ